MVKLFKSDDSVKYTEFLPYKINLYTIDVLNIAVITTVFLVK